jgi:16S rRNA (guanine527-N7)-methyltransferase
VSPTLDPALLETLRQAQRFGFFGRRPIDEAAEHARAFVAALEPFPSGARLVDLGSGGGLPGLVLAGAFPEAIVTLIDRRQKRTDFLERAILRLGYRHVRVLCSDVEVLVKAVAAGNEAAFDAVTARGFGPPDVTLRLGARLLADSGRIVISEPPDGDRWDPRALAELGLSSRRHGPVRVFERSR